MLNVSYRVNDVTLDHEIDKIYTGHSADKRKIKRNAHTYTHQNNKVLY